VIKKTFIKILAIFLLTLVFTISCNTKKATLGSTPVVKETPQPTESAPPTPSCSPSEIYNENTKGCEIIIDTDKDGIPENYGEDVCLNSKYIVDDAETLSGPSELIPKILGCDCAQQIILNLKENIEISDNCKARIQEAGQSDINLKQNLKDYAGQTQVTTLSDKNKESFEVTFESSENILCSGNMNYLLSARRPYYFSSGLMQDFAEIEKAPFAFSNGYTLKLEDIYIKNYTVRVVTYNGIPVYTPFTDSHVVVSSDIITGLKDEILGDIGKGENRGICLIEESELDKLKDADNHIRVEDISSISSSQDTLLVKYQETPVLVNPSGELVTKILDKNCWYLLKADGEIENTNYPEFGQPTGLWMLQDDRVNDNNKLQFGEFKWYGKTSGLSSDSFSMEVDKTSGTTNPGLLGKWILSVGTLENNYEYQIPNGQIWYFPAADEFIKFEDYSGGNTYYPYILRPCSS
jgi:hypothetical protein